MVIKEDFGKHNIEHYFGICISLKMVMKLFLELAWVMSQIYKPHTLNIGLNSIYLFILKLDFIYYGHFIFPDMSENLSV